MTATLRHAIAATIRAEMARRGIRQEDLMAVTGLSRSSISRRLDLDDPKPALNTDELEAIANALGVRPAQLLGDIA